MDRLNNRTMLIVIIEELSWINSWKRCNRTVNIYGYAASIVAQFLYLVRYIMKFSIKHSKKIEDLTQRFRHKL